MDYFLKPVSSANRVVCTRKANGEAAHFSIRYIKDRCVVYMYTELNISYAV